MDVKRAKTAGFCMGVSLALKKLDDELKKKNIAGSRIVTLGSIIHNPQVIEEYEEKGVVRATDLEDLIPGDRVLIRAHGITREKERRLAKLGVVVIDATCPKVKRAQLGIAAMHDNGQTLLLFGEADHPEVRGLLSYAGPEAKVFGSLEEFLALPLDSGITYFLAAQTTQDIGEYNKIIDSAETKLGYKPVALSTVCSATRRRMQETIELARGVDIVVVVGGYESGNTRRLAEAVKAEGKKALHIETPGEIPSGFFAKGELVGLTAGASTPKYLIDAAHKVLQKL